tara:strand:- start:666 stop:878 length:213 start_codon:yes stop_codon:yes gene_type:complete
MPNPTSLKESNTERVTKINEEMQEVLKACNNTCNLKQMIAMALAIPYNSIMLQDFSRENNVEAETKIREL